MALGADRGCPGPGWCARSRVRPQRGRVVPGDLTAGWQRCRRGARGPAEADEHGQLLVSVARTPPDARLVAAVSLWRRWSAQVSRGNRHLTGIGSRQQTVSGCLQQQQRWWSRQPPAVAGEAGDAMSQPVRACARGKMALGADRGCPGPAWCARSRAWPQRGRVCRGHERGHERASAKVKFAGGGGQIRGARRAGSSGLQAAPAATRTSPDTLGPGPRAGSSGEGHRASRGSVVQRRSGISDELPLELTSD